MTTTVERTELLALVLRYGRVCDEFTVASTPAETVLDQIVKLLGPDATELRNMYLAGQSLAAIARATGLSYYIVRQTILDTGTPMRPMGWPKGRPWGRNVDRTDQTAT